MIQSKVFTNLFTWFKKTKKHSFVTHGLPFILFVVGGSLALKQFANIRYELSQHRQQIGVSPELLEKMGFNRKSVKPLSLEEEYANMMKTVDIDNWKNVRGPRPWETDNTQSLEIIEKRHHETKNK